MNARVLSTRTQQLPFACFAIILLFWPNTPAISQTAPDLRQRITLNGAIDDFHIEESVFGDNIGFHSEEAWDDSKWGSGVDLGRLFVTWDHRALYLAALGGIWNNNWIIFVDILPNQGLSDMTQINSWRRNIYFSNDFAPDVFVGTWDGNFYPRLMSQVSGNQIDDQSVGEFFDAASYFTPYWHFGSVEARIPWTTLFRYSTGGIAVVRDTVVNGVVDTLVFLPPGTRVLLAGVVTGAADGTGGPDVAPNNTNGCSDDAFAPLLVDNFAIVELDNDQDGLPDMGVNPIRRVSFKNLAVPAMTTTWGRIKTLNR